MLKKANFKDLLEKSVFYKNIYFSHAFPSLIVKPANLRIAEVNDAAIRLLGFSRTELLKKSICDIHPVKLQSKIKKQYDNFKEKDCFIFDLPAICKNKEKIYVQVSFQKISLKGNEAFIVCLFDLTERIELEKNIKDENHKLMTRTRELLQINRNLIGSYEHLKKKFKDFRIMQKQEVINEKRSVILEISDIIKEKMNAPLAKILEDIGRIRDGGKDLSRESTKRLKMMEEVAENMLITMTRIAEERDIQKMRYVDLEHIE